MSTITSHQKLVAVVVTHNRCAQLKITLKKLLTSSATELVAVVVYDNASTDGTAQWLAAHPDPRLHSTRGDSNIGGAGGFARGIEVALQCFDPDWVVVMDDDARPYEGALSEFQRCKRNPDVARAAAVYLPSGRVCEMNRPSVNPFWNTKTFLRTLFGKGRDGYHIAYANYHLQSALSVDLASFVGLFLSKKMIVKTGLPNHRLFLYGDDVIYTLRLRRQGFQIVFDPTLKFEHDCSTFKEGRNRVFHPLWKVYYAYRNGLVMYKMAAGLLFWLLLPILMVKWHLAANRYGQDHRLYRRIMWQAIRDGVLNQTPLAHQEVLALATRELPA